MEKSSWYEVWALGYDKNDWCTDIEVLLGSFEDLNDANKCFDKYQYIQDIGSVTPYLESGDYLEIVIEEVIDRRAWK